MEDSGKKNFTNKKIDQNFEQFLKTNINCNIPFANGDNIYKTLAIETINRNKRLKFL